MTDVKIKVVNKSKVGVTFRYLGVESFMGRFRDEATWEEFDDMFEKTDKKFIYRVKDEHIEIVKEKHKFFTKLMPHIMILRAQSGNDLASLGHLGMAYEEYRDKFDGSPIDFITEYKQFEKAILEHMMGEGIGVGNVHRRAHGRNEKPEYDYQKKESDFDSSCSIGDMLKAKNR